MRTALIAASAALLTIPAAAKAPTLHVSGWARATVAGQTGSAAYLSIHNAGPGGDRLLGVLSPVAAKVSIHSTSLAGGVTRMRAAGAQAIPQGGKLQMASGGLHLMVTGLKAPLRTGSRLPLILRFQRAGNLRASVPIQMSAPSDRHQH